MYMYNKSFCYIAEIKHNIVNQLSFNKIKKKKTKNLGRAPEVSATGGVLAWVNRQQRFITVVPKSGCILEIPDELYKEKLMTCSDSRI